MSLIDYQSPELRDVFMINGQGINIRRNGSELHLNGYLEAINWKGPSSSDITLYRTNKVAREAAPLVTTKVIRLQANGVTYYGDKRLRMGENNQVIFQDKVFNINADFGSDPQLPAQQTLSFRPNEWSSPKYAVAFDGYHYWTDSQNGKISCAAGPSNSPTPAPTNAPQITNPDESSICNFHHGAGSSGLSKGIAYGNSEFWISKNYNLDTFVRYNVNTGQNLPNFHVSLGAERGIKTSQDFSESFTLSTDGKTLYLVTDVAYSPHFRYVNVLAISTETGDEINLFKLRMPDIIGRDHMYTCGTMMTPQGLAICLYPSTSDQSSSSPLDMTVMIWTLT